jgi:MFS family permease
MAPFKKDKQYIKFCAYGFLKNLRFFDAFLLLFFLENGISYTQIGIIYATREIIINLFEIPSGIIADTYGRKNSLIAAFVAYIISFLFFYFMADFYWFMVAIILYGMGDAFRSGTHKGMIMDYLRLNDWGNHKANYYGHTRSWSQKGSAISALFAGVLVFYSGSYRSIFLYSVIPYLFNFLNIYSYPTELNFSLKKKNDTSKKTIGSNLKSFVKIIRQPKVFQIINSTALHSSFLKAIKDYIQPLMLNVVLIIPVMMSLNEKRKSGIIIGIIYFIIFLLTSYASKTSFKVAQLPFRNIPRLTLLMGLFAGAICGILYYYELWVLSLLAFILIYVLENIRKPMLTGEIADNVPNEILTSVLSGQSFFQTILTSLIAVALGILVDQFGIGISFVIISSCLLLLSFFSIRKKKERVLQ